MCLRKGCSAGQRSEADQVLSAGRRKVVSESFGAATSALGQKPKGERRAADLVRFTPQKPTSCKPAVRSSEGQERQSITLAARASMFAAAGIERQQRFLYSARHGVNRGIQRGTLVRKLWYSVPNVSLSVGSSIITTQT